MLYELRFTVIWGIALLGECMTRLVPAFTVPVSTLSWLAGARLGRDDVGCC